MIELKNVSAGYRDREILHDISMVLPEKEITSIIGPNGSGKSTLLRVITSWIKTSRGEVLLNGKRIGEYSPREIARHIAILPQSREIPVTTVERLVSHGRFPYLGLSRKPTKEDREAVNEAMRSVGVWDMRHRQLSELSGGERQKVYLAMAIAQGTDYLLLDEPTTFLDISYQMEVMSLARRFANEGKSVIAVLHDISAALCISDKLIVLKDGAALACGTPQDILKSNVIGLAFGVDIGSYQQKDGTTGYYFIKKK